MCNHILPQMPASLTLLCSCSHQPVPCMLIHSTPTRARKKVKQTDIFATHTPQLLCDDLSTAFPQRVLVLQTHRWLPFVVANPHNQEVHSYTYTHVCTYDTFIHAACMYHTCGCLS